MRTIDLTQTVDRLAKTATAATRARGESYSAMSALRDLGVEAAPTLASRGTWPFARALQKDAASLPTDEASGETIGRFVIHRELGAGGLGRVLEARG